MVFSLFWAFFRVSASAIGGAYSLLPFLEKVLVEENSWLTNEEFLRIVAASEVMPGAISIKFATYVGYKQAGILGVIISNLANLSVPTVLMLSYYYLESSTNKFEKYKTVIDSIKFSVLGIFSAIIFQYFQKQYKFEWQLIPFFIAFLLIFFLKISPFWIVLGTGILTLGIVYAIG